MKTLMTFDLKSSKALLVDIENYVLKFGPLEMYLDVENELFYGLSKTLA